MKSSKTYYYNRESCSFELVSTSWLKRCYYVFSFVSVAVFGGSAFIRGIYAYIGSPEERKLSKENQVLKTQYEMVIQELGTLKTSLGELQEQDEHVYRVLLKAPPLKKSVRQAGFGGTDRFKHLENYDHVIADTFRQFEQLKHQLGVQRHSYKEIIKLNKEKERRLACLPAVLPLDKKGMKRIGSGFGMRWHPVTGKLAPHRGQDFPAPSGTKVFATGEGVIEKAYRSCSYGNVVIINHGYKLKTLYAHLKKIKVKKGMRVKRMQCIGLSGSTGRSTAPHLHYEVIKEGKKVDPMDYCPLGLSAAEYKELRRLAAIDQKALDYY